MLLPELFLKTIWEGASLGRLQSKTKVSLFVSPWYCNFFQSSLRFFTLHRCGTETRLRRSMEISDADVSDSGTSSTATTSDSDGSFWDGEALTNQHQETDVRNRRIVWFDSEEDLETAFKKLTSTPFSSKAEALREVKIFSRRQNKSVKQGADSKDLVCGARKRNNYAAAKPVPHPAATPQRTQQQPMPEPLSEIEKRLRDSIGVKGLAEAMVPFSTQMILPQGTFRVASHSCLFILSAAIVEELESAPRSTCPVRYTVGTSGGKFFVHCASGYEHSADCTVTAQPISATEIAEDPAIFNAVKNDRVRSKDLTNMIHGTFGLKPSPNVVSTLSLCYHFPKIVRKYLKRNFFFSAFNFDIPNPRARGTVIFQFFFPPFSFRESFTHF